LANVAGHFRVGVDIGGTFTDLLAMDDASGRTFVLKRPSTQSPVDAVVEGIRDLHTRHGIAGEQIAYFAHGTTIGINTLLQRSGARVGVVTTRGFRDVLELRRLRLPSAQNFFAPRPRSLVPRRLVREIDERMLANGQVYRPIRQEDVVRAVDDLLTQGVEAIAVCFLHAYRNATHEQAAKAWIEERWPTLYVCTSAEVWAQQREYERFLISVMNAHIGSRMREYLRSLEGALVERNVVCRVFSTKSNGGVMTAARAAERPVETLLSGPASGVIGSAYLGQLIGEQKLITLDIGGTSADMAVIDGQVAHSTENTIGEFPVIMPAIDVSSVGAGGGSLAWVDREGVLKVGPRSAGALPGPACYGHGGLQPTVTDAYIVSGILNPDSFLGGTLTLQPELSHQTLARLGKQIGLGTRETADSVLRVTTSMLYAELLPELARRGVDVREFSLLAYGGAGPTHAFMAARELPIHRVIVPTTPGTMCALGCLVADLRADFVSTIWQDCADLSTDDLRTAFAALDAEAMRWLHDQSVDVERTYLLRSADMCYVGQSFDVHVPLPDTLDQVTLADAVVRFHERHTAIYGHADASAAARLMTARVQIVGVTSKPAMVQGAVDGLVSPDPGGDHIREVYENGRTWQARVYQRAALRVDDFFSGPAIVEQYDTTTYVPDGFEVHVDRWLNLIGEKLHD
jgi:N-methylhydantoinase A